jgi:cytochrome c-type biogenesis protein CcmF
MIVELGHFALIMALAVAMFQFVVPLYGAQRSVAAAMNTAAPAALLQLTLVALSFLALTNAYLTSDFSVLNVAENSHSAKPLVYKISGVWGNHEGSMLLWVLILAIFGSAVALFGGNLPLELKSRVLAIQGSIGAAFLLFVVVASNPFIRLDPAPIEGYGLNPILQDPALAFHPPFLYAGYVGLSVAFAFAVAALIDGRVDAAWARWVRPWTLAAWMFLTIGIAMGSWWAYYELGWGGWWFWDPVENASLMPWLVATALLHSATVVERRNALKIWTILLSILAFSLSLVGTFLVRSGVLTSVHAFAVDPARGVFILGILCLFIGGALTLFAWRAPALKPSGLFAPISREGGLVFNNLFLCIICLAVFAGTLAPLVGQTFGYVFSVGPQYFNPVVGILSLPLLLAVPLGPFLSWKRADLRATLSKLTLAAAAAALAGFVVAVVSHRGPWLAPLGMAMATWLVAGALLELAARIGLFKTSIGNSLSRLMGLPPSAIGMTLAHGGLGVMIVGMVGISVWKTEAIISMKPGDTHPLADYEVTFRGETPLTGPNYTGSAGQFLVTRAGAAVTALVSEKRVFRPSNMPTTEVGLKKTMLGDLYVVLGDETADGGRAVRMYFNPLVDLIWIGALIMFAGGAFSLADRRYRVGAPVKARREQVAAAE